MRKLFEAPPSENFWLVPLTEEQLASERIVCSAVRMKFSNEKESIEVNIPMVRHYSPDCHPILNTFAKIYPKEEEICQGFMTNKGRFVNRKQGLEIAKRQNQIINDIGYEPNELFSEMMW